MKMFKKWFPIISAWTCRPKLTSCFFLLLVAFLVFRPEPSWAASSFIHQTPTYIGKNQTVENIVVFGSQADIDGTVTDTVIVIGGDVHLGSTAKAGMVIDWGGAVKIDPGARIGDLHTLSWNRTLRNSMIVGSSLVLLFWVLRLSLSTVLIIVPTLLTLALQPWLHRPLAYLEKSARRMVVIGFLATVVLLAIASLFAVTVIGLPLAVLLFLLYALAGFIGLAVTAVWIGKLAALHHLPEKQLWLQGLVGSTLIMAFANVPLIGPFLLLLLWLAGCGTISVWLWQKGRKKT